MPGPNGGADLAPQISLKRFAMLSGPPTICVVPVSRVVSAFPSTVQRCCRKTLARNHDRRKNHQSLQVSICPVTADPIGQTNPGEIASTECSVCATETSSELEAANSKPRPEM